MTKTLPICSFVTTVMLIKTACCRRYLKNEKKQKFKQLQYPHKPTLRRKTKTGCSVRINRKNHCYASQKWQREM